MRPKGCIVVSAENALSFDRGILIFFNIDFNHIFYGSHQTY